MGSPNIASGEQTASKVETSAKQEGKKRSAIGSTNESILDFIMTRELHECDAIRVAMNIVKSGTKTSNIAESDAAILNAFMNEGLKQGGNNTMESVMAHRQHKAYKLTLTMGKFFDKFENITVMSGTLMLFASTPSHVNDILGKLNPNASKSAGNVANNAIAGMMQNGNQPSNQ